MITADVDDGWEKRGVIVAAVNQADAIVLKNDDTDLRCSELRFTPKFIVSCTHVWPQSLRGI